MESLREGARLSSNGLPVLGGRYRLLHRIKSALGVETWRGVDLIEGGAVAVKTLPVAGVPAGVRARFEHETRILRGLRGPYITPLLDAGQSEGRVYLVMPWITGQTLAERLAQGPLSVSDSLWIARGVLLALQQAHESGVLHRDLKPSNVIVDDATRPPRVVLIDFGYAHSFELDSEVRDLPVGTVLYMSPEQAGLVERDVGERSDLYSLGALLFECLLGRPPFTGDSVSEVLRQHLSTPPPGLPATVPRVLDELVHRLLRKEPRDRYQSAAGVLADVDRIAAAIDRGITEPQLVIGLADKRQSLAEPAFVGRAQELSLLHAGFERARRGTGGLVLLEAESGVGKTRLLDEVAAQCSRDAWVLRGQALVGVALRPYQLLVGIVHDILTAARGDPQFATGLRARLGDQHEALCAAFPNLAEILDVMGTPGATAAATASTTESLGPETLAEARTLTALDRLFEALGTAGRPALLLLDDCQWADDASLKLLLHFHQQHGDAAHGRPSYVMVVASFRSEEVTEGHVLRVMPGGQRIVLAPLEGGEVRALVESMAGRLPDEAVRVVEHLCEGSPFMATAVLRGMVESNALVAEEGRFRVVPLALDDVRSSGQAAVFLARRMERLPRATLRLLSIGAVLGREFDVDLAASLAGEPLEKALLAADEARHRGIVWNRSGDHRSVFVHDKLREALLARMSGEARRRLHFEAALQIEARDRSRAFDIAYHFDAAGEPGRALHYALAAGDLARSRHSLDIAEVQYRIARRGASGDRPAVSLRIAEGLGDILMLRGRYDEAASEYDSAQLLASSAIDQARFRGKMGELSFKRGDMEMAARHIERGLGVLGRQVPRGRVALLARLLFEIIVQVLHELLPGLFMARRSPTGPDADREFQAIHLYSRLAHVSWFQRGNVATAWAHLREMNLAERYPPTLHLAQAWSEHAPVMTMLPWFSRGVAYAKRSYEIRKALGDVWGQGQSLHFLGVVLYAASRLDECAESCREAVRLLERTGDRWEINTAQWHIAYCHYRLGRLASAVYGAQRVHQAGIDIGDAQARGISLSVWAKASQGDVPEALIAAELKRETSDVHTRAEVLQARALCLLRKELHEQAATALREADELVVRSGMKQEYVAPVLPWLTTALRIGVEAVPATAPDRRRALLRVALATSRRAVRRARSYRNNLPHALRERAILLAIQGRTRRAQRAFEQSLSWAEHLKMREEAALTRSARGHVGSAAGVGSVGSAASWPGAADDLFQGEKTLNLLRSEITPRAPLGVAPVTPSLVERFEQLLDAGRRLTTALTPTAIFAAVREQATRLLRGDQCFVLQSTGPSGELIPASDLDHGPFSRTVAHRALSTGKPALFSEETIEPGDSVILSGARSGLCAPIWVRGRTTACFYVTHHQLGRLFGETEERLAEFIATLAGAALENAEGFASVQALSEERGRRYREAQEAVRARDEFLSIAAHELRTPLTSMGVQLKSLQRSARGVARAVTPAELLERLDRCLRQFDRYLELLSRLLDVSRIIEGRIILEPEEMNLSTLVGDVLERLGADAAFGGTPLVLRSPDVAPELLTGHWDRVRLDQVVTNLMTNAIKFGAGKPVTVELAGDGNTVRLCVRDQGIGIAPKDQARIFERFERAVSMVHYGGLGLGLWITRQIVEAMGGTIRVESIPNQGSTFTVELPRDGQAKAPDVMAPAVLT